jgi:hypothetical protein
MVIHDENHMTGLFGIMSKIFECTVKSTKDKHHRVLFDPSTLALAVRLIGSNKKLYKWSKKGEYMVC